MTETLISRLISAFSSMGLTTYEARAYIALLQKRPANGYEISRMSQVPGPKIYETLGRLMGKGLVAPIEADPVLYEPLPYEDFLKYKEKELENTSQFLRDNLENMVTSDSPQLIWHVSGYDALIMKATEILNNSEKEVLISVWEELAKDLGHLLEKAVARNVKVTSIQFGKVVDVGVVYRHILVDAVYKRHGNEMILVVDNKYGLFMNLVAGREWEGNWTSNPGVINMISNYIRHDIYVNKILDKMGAAAFEEYGPQLEKLLQI